MASTSEFEQQQFWEDKPIEIILGDNSSWDLKIIYCNDLINNIPAKPEDLTQFILITKDGK